MDILLRKKKENAALVNKRSFERVSTSINARFFFGNLFYSGTLLNVSEKGMFINTKRYLPIESMFVVIFRLDNELFKIIAKVKRVAKDDSTNGMGIELLSPSNDYMEYINSLKSH
jgi:hypothetical protein